MDRTQKFFAVMHESDWQRTSAKGMVTPNSAVRPPPLAEHAHLHEGAAFSPLSTDVRVHVDRCTYYVIDLD